MVQTNRRNAERERRRFPRGRNTRAVCQYASEETGMIIRRIGCLIKTKIRRGLSRRDAPPDLRIDSSTSFSSPERNSLLQPTCRRVQQQQQQQQPSRRRSPLSWSSAKTQCDSLSSFLSSRCLVDRLKKNNCVCLPLFHATRSE